MAAVAAAAPWRRGCTVKLHTHSTPSRAFLLLLLSRVFAQCLHRTRFTWNIIEGCKVRALVREEKLKSLAPEARGRGSRGVSLLKNFAAAPGTSRRARESLCPCDLPGDKGVAKVQHLLPRKLPNYPARFRHLARTERRDKLFLNAVTSELSPAGRFHFLIKFSTKLHTHIHARVRNPQAPRPCAKTTVYQIFK